MSRLEGKGTVLARQFQLFLEATDEYAVFLLDAEGRVASWNPGAQRILGYSQEEAIGQHFSIYFPSEDRETGRPKRGLQTALEEGEWVDEGWRICKDGRRIWVRVTIRPLHDDDGQLRGYAKITRDLTEQRRARRAVEEAEEICRALTENAAVGIIMMQDGRFVYMNPAFTEIVGYRREELLGYSPELLLDANDWPRVRAMMLAQRTTGEADDDVHLVQIRTKEGARRTVELRGSRITYHGAPALIGTVCDVTEQQRRERALQESEEKFRALAEQSLVGIGLIQDGIYAYVNPTFAGYFGYDADELIGESPARVIHPDDWPRVRDLMRRHLDQEDNEIRYTARGLTRDGDTIYLNATGHPVAYNEQPALVEGSLDVTRERTLEEELLQVQDEERERVAYDLHDGVGAFLTAALMVTRSVSRNLANGKKVTPADFDKIAEHIGQAAREVRAISHGLSPLGLELGLPVALDGLATQTDVGSDLTCRFETDDTLPDLPEPVAAHLYRIAQEAVNNAVRHGAPSRIWVRLAVDAEGTLVLEVEDDGRGLSESEIESGLGLRTMRHRANLIDGRLEIEVRDGGGTRIVCRAPKSD